eukprot:g3262.t1
MAVLANRLPSISALFGQRRRVFNLRRYSHQTRSLQCIAKRPPTTPSFRLRPLRVHESNKEALPELSLFKQLETELASLGDALVKIQHSRVADNEDDETLLTTLIEEVQREQEAWFLQVQVMERLVTEAASLETGETELQDLRQKYNALRNKVELYNGLLSEREREVVTLKQQLEDVNNAAELHELQKATLKELVATTGETVDTELRLPAWSTKAVSDFLVKNEPVVDVDTKDQPQVAKKRTKDLKEEKKMELPGLAVLSALSYGVQVIGELWESTTADLPREVRDLVEVAIFCTVIASGFAMVSHGTV